jgi:transketolase
MPRVESADLRQTAREIRRQVIELSYSSKSGHIGSSLSCVELLVALYFRFLKVQRGQPLAKDRDRFLMSKGHACIPYYACLERMGFLPADVLRRYGEEGGTLGHHPAKCAEYGIEISTGSLGHGLSVGSGMAFTAKLSNLAWRAVVMMSDGEQNEGAVWEAAMFAAHHKLDNLLAIVDFNKMQALGDNADIVNIEKLDERYRSFGWAVRRLDGHDLDAIVEALAAFPFESGKPSVIVADTIKGKGVSFMENSLLWHYRCPDPKEYAAALAELDHA